LDERQEKGKVKPMKLPDSWSPVIVIGWLVFFTTFLGLDFIAMISRDPRIPTFSRVVGRLLPWVRDAVFMRDSDDSLCSDLFQTLRRKKL
jgi:hypothetical protein